MPIGELGWCITYDPVAEILATLKDVQPGTTWCRTEHRGDGKDRLHLTILMQTKDPSDIRVLILDGHRAGETATLRDIELASMYRIVHMVTYHYVPEDEFVRAFR